MDFHLESNESRLQIEDGSLQGENKQATNKQIKTKRLFLVFHHIDRGFIFSSRPLRKIDKLVNIKLRSAVKDSLKRMKI